MIRLSATPKSRSSTPCSTKMRAVTSLSDAGFENCLKDYDKYTHEECRQKGINDSIIHVDFMIGSQDLDIDAHTADGRDVAIFRNGNWAF